MFFSYVLQTFFRLVFPVHLLVNIHLYLLRRSPFFRNMPPGCLPYYLRSGDQNYDQFSIGVSADMEYQSYINN